MSNVVETQVFPVIEGDTVTFDEAGYWTAPPGKYEESVLDEGEYYPHILHTMTAQRRSDGSTVVTGRLTVDMESMAIDCIGKILFPHDDLYGWNGLCLWEPTFQRPEMDGGVTRSYMYALGAYLEQRLYEAFPEYVFDEYVFGHAQKYFKRYCFIVTAELPAGTPFTPGAALEALEQPCAEIGGGLLKWTPKGKPFVEWAKEHIKQNPIPKVTRKYAKQGDLTGC